MPGLFLLLFISFNVFPLFLHVTCFWLRQEVLFVRRVRANKPRGGWRGSLVNVYVEWRADGAPIMRKKQDHEKMVKRNVRSMAPADLAALVPN